MFEDLDSDEKDERSLEERSDREILHALWGWQGQALYDSIEAWAVLVDRYPDDVRLSLILVATPFVESPDDLSPEDPGLSRLERLAAEPSIREPFTCLLRFVGKHAGRLWRGDELRRWHRLAKDLSERSDTDALVVIEKWTAALFQACDDATVGNKPLATSRKPA